MDTVSLLVDSCRIRARTIKDGYGESAWKTSNYCQVSIVAAGSRRLFVPSYTTTGLAYISWFASTTAGVSYVLEEATDSGFTQDLRIAYNGSATSAMVNAADGTYYYRVKAVKAGYSDSPWKIGRSCSYTLTAKGSRRIYVPSSSNTGSVHVSWWDSGTVGASYVLEIDDGGGFVEVYSAKPTSTTISGLPSGNYTFRVKATMAGYTDSSWRTSWSVTVY